MLAMWLKRRRRKDQKAKRSKGQETKKENEENVTMGHVSYALWLFATTQEDKRQSKKKKGKEKGARRGVWIESQNNACSDPL